MIMQGKYVMTRKGAILFPDTFLHSEFKFLFPTSAGRFNIYKGEVEVYSESVSLNLKPAEDDAEKIKRSFNNEL